MKEWTSEWFRTRPVRLCSAQLLTDHRTRNSSSFSYFPPVSPFSNLSLCVHEVLGYVHVVCSSWRLNIFKSCGRISTSFAPPPLTLYVIAQPLKFVSRAVWTLTHFLWLHCRCSAYRLLLNVYWLIGHFDNANKVRSQQRRLFAPSKWTVQMQK